MKLIREKIEKYYPNFRDKIFRNNDINYETIDKLNKYIKFITKFNLEKLLFDQYYNDEFLSFELSNAAGFNINGDISPDFFKYLGFNRMVIGSVTGDEWDVSKIQKGQNYELITNLINFSSIGAERVYENLQKFKEERDYLGKIGIPITINVMATPSKKGDEALKDLEKSIFYTKKYTDRFEFDIQSLDIYSKEKKINTTISEYQKELSKIFDVFVDNIDFIQTLYLKIPSHLKKEEVNGILDLIEDYKYPKLQYFEIGIVIANNKLYNNTSSKKEKENLKNIHEYISNEIKRRDLRSKIIIIGNINNIRDIREGLKYSKTKGFQIGNSLIYNGPELLTKLRKFYNS